MRITEVHIKIEPSGERLLGYCTFTIDDSFVIREVKILSTKSGVRIGMPSRKKTDHCPQCRENNHLEANYCNRCGVKLPPVANPVVDERTGRIVLYADVCHPISTSVREYIEGVLVAEYRKKLAEERAMAAG